eukprot:TRINITY_DN4909_c0_g1_i1.p1 TRINITY_DN4909_c0_g1~~TRINITY_DN4909_c0_g1_i1.p1  ORF type:complete len:2115 (+),score=597.56 TRINITY_DN4909_c0_g1_i1:203-6547(+)
MNKLGSLVDLETIIKSRDRNAISNTLESFINQVRYDHSLIEEYIMRDPTMGSLFLLFEIPQTTEPIHLILAMASFTRILSLGERNDKKSNAIQAFTSQKTSLINFLFSSSDPMYFEVIAEVSLAIAKFGVESCSKIIRILKFEQTLKKTDSNWVTEVVQKGFRDLISMIEIVIRHQNDDLLSELLKSRGLEQVLKKFDCSRHIFTAISLLVSIENVWKAIEISPRNKIKLLKLFVGIIADAMSLNQTKSWAHKVFQTTILDKETGVLHLLESFNNDYYHNQNKKENEGDSIIENFFRSVSLDDALSFQLILRLCELSPWTIPLFMSSIQQVDSKSPLIHSNIFNFIISLWNIPFPSSKIRFPLHKSKFVCSIAPEWLWPSRIVDKTNHEESDLLRHQKLMFTIGMMKRAQNVWETVKAKYWNTFPDDEKAKRTFYEIQTEVGKEVLRALPSFSKFKDMIVNSGKSKLIVVAAIKCISQLSSITKLFGFPHIHSLLDKDELDILEYISDMGEGTKLYFLNSMQSTSLNMIPNLFKLFASSKIPSRSVILKKLQTIISVSLGLFPISIMEVYAWVISLNKTPQFMVETLKEVGNNFEAIFKYEELQNNNVPISPIYEFDINSKTKDSGDVFTDYSLLTFCILSKLRHMKEDEQLKKNVVSGVSRFFQFTSNFNYSLNQTIRVLQSNNKEFFDELPQFADMLKSLKNREKLDVHKDKKTDFDVNIQEFISRIEKTSPKDVDTILSKLLDGKNEMERMIFTTCLYTSFLRTFDSNIPSGELLDDKTKSQMEKYLNPISLILKDSCANGLGLSSFTRIFSSQLVISSFYNDSFHAFSPFISEWSTKLLLWGAEKKDIWVGNEDLWRPYFNRIYRSLLNDINSMKQNQITNQLFSILLRGIGIKSLEIIGIKLAENLEENRVERKTVIVIIDSLEFIAKKIKLEDSIQFFKLLLDLTKLFRFDYQTMNRISSIILPILQEEKEWNKSYTTLELGACVDSSHLNNFLDGLIQLEEEGEVVWKQEQIDICCLLVRSCQFHRIYFIEYCKRLIARIQSEEEEDGMIFESDEENKPIEMEDKKNEKEKFNLLPLIPLLSSLFNCCPESLREFDEDFLDFLFKYILENIFERGNQNSTLGTSITVLKHIKQFSTFEFSSLLEMIETKKLASDVNVQLLSLLLNFESGEEKKRKKEKKNQVLCLKYLMNEFHKMRVSENVEDLMMKLKPVYSKMKKLVETFAKKNLARILNESFASSFFLQLLKKTKPKEELKSTILQLLFNSSLTESIIHKHFPIMKLQVTESYTMKYKLFLIIETVLSWRGKLDNSEKLFKLFLESYQGTNSPLDNLILRCLNLIKDRTSSFERFEYLYGTVMKDDSCLKEYYSQRLNLSEEEIGKTPKGLIALLYDFLLDPKIVKRTIQDIFSSEPKDSHLQNSTGINQFGENIPSFNSKSMELVYYPVYNYEFILRMLKTYLNEPILLNYPSLLLTCGALSIALACLASPSLSIRKLASHVLQGYHLILVENDKRWNYRLIICAMVQCAKQEIKEPFQRVSSLKMSWIIYAMSDLRNLDSHLLLHFGNRLKNERKITKIFTDSKNPEKIAMENTLKILTIIQEGISQSMKNSFKSFIIRDLQRCYQRFRSSQSLPPNLEKRCHKIKNLILQIFELASIHPFICEIYFEYNFINWLSSICTLRLEREEKVYNSSIRLVCSMVKSCGSNPSRFQTCFNFLIQILKKVKQIQWMEINDVYVHLLEGLHSILTAPKGFNFAIIHSSLLHKFLTRLIESCSDQYILPSFSHFNIIRKNKEQNLANESINNITGHASEMGSSFKKVFHYFRGIITHNQPNYVPDEKWWRIVKWVFISSYQDLSDAKERELAIVHCLGWFLSNLQNNRALQTDLLSDKRADILNLLFSFYGMGFCGSQIVELLNSIFLITLIHSQVINHLSFQSHQGQSINMVLVNTLLPSLLGYIPHPSVISLEAKEKKIGPSSTTLVRNRYENEDSEEESQEPEPAHKRMKLEEESGDEKNNLRDYSNQIISIFIQEYRIGSTSHHLLEAIRSLSQFHSSPQVLEESSKLKLRITEIIKLFVNGEKEKVPDEINWNLFSTNKGESNRVHLVVRNVGG